MVENKSAKPVYRTQNGKWGLTQTYSILLRVLAFDCQMMAPIYLLQEFINTFYGSLAVLLVFI